MQMKNMMLVESDCVIVCKTDEISLKYAMKQIVIHVVVVARRNSGCFNEYNGIKDAWKCVWCYCFTVREGL